MKKKSYILFSIIFLGALYFMAFASLIAEKQDYSHYENRSLAAFPAFTWDSFWDSSYFSQVDNAIDDHLFQRTNILKATTQLNIKLGRPVVSEVVIPNTKLNGTLTSFEKYNRQSEDFAYASDLAGEQVTKLNDLITGYGGYFIYTSIPQQGTYFADIFPDFLETPAQDDEMRTQFFSEELSRRNIPFVDMWPVFKEQNRDVPLYYESDHHTNHYGGLLTYRAIVNRINADTGLGITILQDGDFEFQTLPNPFLGSFNRKLFGLQHTKDKVVITNLEQKIPHEVWDNTKNAPGAIYVMPYDEWAETAYHVYMGGDVGELIVTTDRPELPTCLIFGDSYTNVVETMLWTGFDEMRSLDLRYYSEKTLAQYIADWQPDVVVNVQGPSKFFDTEGNAYYGFE